jgi:hypothetical protein
VSGTANEIRGEVALRLPGGVVVLRPSFGALVAAEAELGSLFALLERAGCGEVRLGEMAGLFWHCAVAPEMVRDRFEAELVALGPARLLGPYKALLGAIFGG